MSCKEDTLTVLTYDIKVSIHCDACIEKVKRVLRKIDGVYKSTIDEEQGKLTVSGVVDVDTIIKRLNKAGKPAVLWGSTLGIASQSQEIQLGDGGEDQPKDTNDKGQKSEVGGGSCCAGAAGGAKDSNMVQPQSMPQQIQQIQQQLHQMEPRLLQQIQQLQELKQQVQQLQMRATTILPPQRMDGKMPFPTLAANTAKEPKSVRFNLHEAGQLANGGKVLDNELKDDEDSGDDGLTNFNSNQVMMMKAMAMPSASGGGGKNGGAGGGSNGCKNGSGNMIPVQTNKGSTNNADGGRKHSGGKKSQGGGGGNINNGGHQNGGGGQPPQNVVLGGATQPSQGKKDLMDGLGSGSMGSMQPQPSTMRPNTMGGMQPQPGMVRLNTMGSMRPQPAMVHMGSRPMSMPTGQFLMGGMHQGGGRPGSAVTGKPAGGMAGAGFYQGDGNGMPAGMEMMQAAVGIGNPMAQQQYMAMVQQQQQRPQPSMVMNGQDGYPDHQGQGSAGYPLMPMGYGYGNLPLQYPTAYPQPPPSHAEPYNIFSDENPNNSCSVM